MPLNSTATRLAQKLLPLLSAIVSLFLAIHLAFAAPPAHASPPAAEIMAARVAGTESRTRFVADLDRPVSYSVYVISDPYRVVVDMHDVRFNMPASLGEASRGLIREFRFGQVGPGKSRMVIDTEGPVLIEKSFVLNASNGEPARMVIDLVQTDERTFARVKSTEQPALADAGGEPRIEPASAPDPVPQSLAELLAGQLAGDDGQPDSAGARTVPKPRPKPQQIAALAGAARDAATPAVAAPAARPVVVLDPGHGGVDGGTVSSNGVKEKDVVLDFARELARALKQTGRYDVHLTRGDDTFISLGKRVRIARGHKADLFIAIHADSLRQRGVRGATVYTLSEEASDSEAAALAEKENAADFIGGIDLGEDIDEEVSGILLDLALRETKNHSIYFARRVVKSLGPVSPLNHRPMRSAGFKVLKAPDVPSVLLELGYLSNRHDEKNLISPKWREKAAGAVSSAIDAFFSPEVAARQSAAQ